VAAYAAWAIAHDLRTRSGVTAGHEGTTTTPL
jgi:hypothetical protein